MIASTASDSIARTAVKRIMRGALRSFRLPLFHPQRRRGAVAGGADAFEPERHDEADRAEEHRQRRQVLGVDLLVAAPECPALLAVELPLDAVEEGVHLRARVAGEVLALEAVGGGGD